nr:MAG TPA: HNH endonuclease bacteriophage, HNH Endonuclease, DNA.52A [Caudoviricetes sp.]
MSLRRCAWHNCPQLVPQGARFCKAHAHAYERRRGTSGQRGYGAAHRRERAWWQAAMDAGAVPICAKCNKPVLPSQPWDLGHTDDRKAWTGPEHRSCNRRDGQRKAVSSQERWR